MRHHRRDFGRATYATLLVRVGEIVRAFVVGFDGYTFTSFEDVNKVLNYERLREVYKVCPNLGEYVEIKDVLCWKHEKTFYAFTQVVQRVDFASLRTCRIGGGIYDALRNAVDECSFDVLPSFDAVEFIETAERIARYRYTIATGSYAALVATDVLG